MPSLTTPVRKKDAAKSTVKTASTPLPQRPDRPARSNSSRRSKTLSKRELEVISASQTSQNSPTPDEPQMMECSSFESSPQVVVHQSRDSKKKEKLPPKRQRSVSPSSPKPDTVKKKVQADLSKPRVQSEAVKSKIVTTKNTSSNQKLCSENRYEVLSLDEELSETTDCFNKPNCPDKSALKEKPATASRKPSLSRSLTSARDFLMEAKNSFKL